MTEIERYEYKGYTIVLHTDDDPESPREWDNLGTFWTWDRRYMSPDKHDYADPRRGMEDIYLSSAPESRLAYHDEWDDAKLRKEAEKYAIILDVFKYEHGGVAYSTSSFSCPWDSGQVGWIWVSLADVRKEYGRKLVSKNTRERAVKALQNEVKVYSDYANGEVYGYVIEKDGEEVESCWGCYSLDLIKDEVKYIIDSLCASQNASAEEAHAQ